MIITLLTTTALFGINVYMIKAIYDAIYSRGWDKGYDAAPSSTPDVFTRYDVNPLSMRVHSLEQEIKDLQQSKKTCNETCVQNESVSGQDKVQKNN